MDNERGRSLLWPLLLTLTGVVLLLDELGLLSLDLARLARLWPLLLVLLGLDLLLRSRGVSRDLAGLIAILLVAAVAALVYPSLSANDTLETREFSFPVGDITSAKVILQVGTGAVKVRVLEESDQLVEAVVNHSSRSQLHWEASVNDRVATITMGNEGQATATPFGEANHWVIGLNREIPLSLVLDCGVGRTELDLHGLQLSRIKVQGGVGEVEIVLPEDGQYEVEIVAGVGPLVLTVPEGIEARVRLSKGLGPLDISERFRQEGTAYVTEGYELARKRADIIISGGVGHITIR